MCKEKFYGSVHTALRTWVAAAAEDGWEVREGRFGPSPEVHGGSTGKAGNKAAAAALLEGAPRLEMPRLDFEPSRPRAAAGNHDAWL
ncbi:hypothetical protein CDD83_6179 [Cordyceps sp. RAO-2017]|nr:hypothetical protein CDD83_6179 [Cordyceps sp. RAO-2017]